MLPTGIYKFIHMRTHANREKTHEMKGAHKITHTNVEASLQGCVELSTMLKGILEVGGIWCLQ